jgi:putative transposase
LKQFRSYKFRLYPNDEQKILLNKTFGCVRFIYNKMLSDKIQYYKETKQTLYNTPAQYKSEFKWLKEVDSHALCNAQLNLQKAYKNFFQNKKVGFPKFKKKHGNIFSFTTNNDGQGKAIFIKDKYVKLPKVGFLKIVQHRSLPVNGIIKSCTISKIASEKYYISLLVEYDKDTKKHDIDISKSIGLDMDMKNLYTDSQGVRAEYPHYYKLMLNKIIKEQKKLSLCKSGSNNRNKQRLKVAKLHEKVANQRRDFLHKLSSELVSSFDVVCIEDLDMKAMSQRLNLGKSVFDNSWGMFTTFLRYKLDNEGKMLIKIDKWYPSSKRCNECGFINSELQLSDRKWVCSNCGNLIDRDYNAAKNIKDEGIRQII